MTGLPVAWTLASGDKPRRTLPKLRAASRGGGIIFVKLRSGRVTRGTAIAHVAFDQDGVGARASIRVGFQPGPERGYCVEVLATASVLGRPYRAPNCAEKRQGPGARSRGKPPWRSWPMQSANRARNTAFHPRPIAAADVCSLKIRANPRIVSATAKVALRSARLRYRSLRADMLECRLELPRPLSSFSTLLSQLEWAPNCRAAPSHRGNPRRCHSRTALFSLKVRRAMVWGISIDETASIASVGRAAAEAQLPCSCHITRRGRAMLLHVENGCTGYHKTTPAEKAEALTQHRALPAPRSCNARVSGGTYRRVAGRYSNVIIFRCVPAHRICTTSCPFLPLFSVHGHADHSALSVTLQSVHESMAMISAIKGSVFVIKGRTPMPAI